MKAPTALVLLLSMLLSACGPSEKSETQQKIVDVYEGWEAEMVSRSCPRYYGFPVCPDVNRYKSEINAYCNERPSIASSELSAMLTSGWTVQSHEDHIAEAHREMQDGIRVAITCKGQRYIITRTCVTKINWLGQETPDPRCEPSKAPASEPASNAVGNAMDDVSDYPVNVSDVSDEESLDAVSNAVDAAAIPEPSKPPAAPPQNLLDETSNCGWAEHPPCPAEPEKYNAM